MRFIAYECIGLYCKSISGGTRMQPELLLCFHMQTWHATILQATCLKHSIAEYTLPLSCFACGSIAWLSSLGMSIAFIHFAYCMLCLLYALVVYALPVS